MNTHNVCFHGEKRKMSTIFVQKILAEKSDFLELCQNQMGNTSLT